MAHPKDFKFNLEGERGQFLGFNPKNKPQSDNKEGSDKKEGEYKIGDMGNKCRVSHTMLRCLKYAE